MRNSVGPRLKRVAICTAIVLSVVGTRAFPSRAADPPHTAAPAVAVPEIAAGSAVELGDMLVHQRCANCHSVEPGVKSFAAPLTNLFGRVSGTAEGYFFSPNMKNLAVTWSPKTLDDWLAATTFDTPDIRMRHVGIPEPRARAAVISYIGTLEGNSGP